MTEIILLIAGTLLTNLTVQLGKKYEIVKKHPKIVTCGVSIVAGALYTIFALYFPADLQKNIIEYCTQVLAYATTIYVFLIKDGK